MIFFGHLGITTVAVKTYEKTSNIGKKSEKKNFLDYRMVLIGAILPDLIDKPLSILFLDRFFHNTRIFAHTLIFNILLFGIGIYLLIKNNKNSVFLLSVATTFHLILDSMWDYKETLLWPFFGWKFPARKSGTWIGNSMDRLISDPWYYIPEIIGFFVILFLFIRLIKNKKVKEFISNGKL